MKPTASSYGSSMRKSRPRSKTAPKIWSAICVWGPVRVRLELMDGKGIGNRRPVLFLYGGARGMCMWLGERDRKPALAGTFQVSKPQARRHRGASGKGPCRFASSREANLLPALRERPLARHRDRLATLHSPASKKPCLLAEQPPWGE